MRVTVSAPQSDIRLEQGRTLFQMTTQRRAFETGLEAR